MAANGDNANSVNAQVNGSGPSTAAALQKTFVSVFHELCTKFGFGVAMYNLDSTTGEPHNKTFCISLTVNTLGITGIHSLFSRSYCCQKHRIIESLFCSARYWHDKNEGKAWCSTQNDAWDQEKNSGRRKLKWCPQRKTVELLWMVSVILCCCFLKCLLTCFVYRMQKYESLNDDEPLQPTQPTNAAGVLTSWLLTRHRALPVYRVLKTTGPSHSRIYWMSCKLDHRVTEGRVY